MSERTLGGQEATAGPGAACCIRIGNRHSAEIKYPAALMNRTFYTPMVAMPRPLIAGPMRTAMFTPPCISALAAVNRGRETINGTADERAGPKMVEAIAIRRTIT